MLHVDAPFSKAFCDRLIDAVDGAADAAASGARLAADGAAELGADPVPVAVGIAGTRGRDQLIELVFGGLPIT